MQIQVIQMAQIVAATSIYVAVSVVTGGIVSGLVVLGAVQVYAREKIQRDVLTNFFAFAYLPTDVDRTLTGVGAMFGFGRRKGDARTAANLLGMPEAVLCRLYYRQITGQFIAAVDSEASTKGKDIGPVLSSLSKLGSQGVSGAGSTGRGASGPSLEGAMRQIDILQARLGEAVSKSAMLAMTLAWSLFYIAVVILAEAARFSALRAHGDVGFGLLAWLGYWLPWGLLAILVGFVLGFCSAACGLVAFNWLDRFTAAK